MQICLKTVPAIHNYFWNAYILDIFSKLIQSSAFQNLMQIKSCEKQVYGLLPEIVLEDTFSLKLFSCFCWSKNHELKQIMYSVLCHGCVLCSVFDFCTSEVIQGLDFSVSCYVRCSKCSYFTATCAVSCLIAYIKLSLGNLEIKPWLLWCHNISLMCVCTASQFKTSCVVFPLSGLRGCRLGTEIASGQERPLHGFEKRHNWRHRSDTKGE